MQGCERGDDEMESHPAALGKQGEVSSAGRESVIIFVSQSADKLLPTILSRLQRVHVPRLSDSEAAHGISAKTGLSEELAQSFAHITDRLT